MIADGVLAINFVDPLASAPQERRWRHWYAKLTEVKIFEQMLKRVGHRLLVTETITVQIAKLATFYVVQLVSWVENGETNTQCLKLPLRVT